MKKFINLPNWFTALAALGVVTFSSCQKNTVGSGDATETAATIEASENNASAENEYDDVFNITMNVQSSDVGEEIGLGGTVVSIYGRSADVTTTPPARCFTVTVVPNTLHVFPKTVTVDFGIGCLGRDGKLRRGKIVTVYTGPMQNPGSKATTTFIDYNVDSFKVEGTFQVENTSSSNLRSFTVTVSGGKISNTVSAKWKTWNSTKVITQTEGNGTPAMPLDDVFSVTGNASGSNSGGNTWTADVTSALIKKFVCPWLVQGTVRVSRNTHSAIIDFGTGTCDNQATITINGVSYIITLH